MESVGNALHNIESSIHNLEEAVDKVGTASGEIVDLSLIHIAALQAGLVQKVQAYVAPKLFGGATAKTPVEGQGFLKPAAVSYTHLDVYKRQLWEFGCSFIHKCA